MSAPSLPNLGSFIRGLWIRLLPKPKPSNALEERIAKLEAEVSQLKNNQLNPQVPQLAPWWEDIAGSFANDPLFDQAMTLGAEYRRSSEQSLESAEP